MPSSIVSIGNLSTTERYEQLAGMRDFYRKLDEGMTDIRAGRTRLAEDVFAEIEGSSKEYATE